MSTNIRPIADAGSVKYNNGIGNVTSLDGSRSYDPDNLPSPLSYHWEQIDGPTVELVDANTAKPSFSPKEYAIYRFQLIVNDGLNDSEPSVIEFNVYDLIKLDECKKGCEETFGVSEHCPIWTGACMEDCAYKHFFHNKRKSSEPSTSLQDFFKTYTTVRDQLLAGTPEGQRYLAVFNEYRTELLSIGLAHPELVDKIVSAETLAEPLFAKLFSGQGEQAVISAELIQQVNDIFNDFLAIASPGLKQEILNEKQRLGDLNTFIGKTLPEAQTKTLGHGVFLPRLSNP